MKWKLGAVSGIGIYVHWTFWLLPAWILFSGWGGSGGLTGAVGSVLFVFAIFGCVVLHELGHAWAARLYHIRTRDITLYPIGGVASLERIPRKPIQEFVIAVAGPAVNVVIAGVLFTLLVVGGIGTQGLLLNLGSGSFLINLLVVNVALVVFNMLPAFPMDGGRVLRSLLAMHLPYLRATEIAVRVGQVVAVLMALLGLLTGGTLLLVALFVYLAAQAELVMARQSAFVPSWADCQIRSPGSSECQNDSGIIWLEPRSGSSSGFFRAMRVQ